MEKRDLLLIVAARLNYLLDSKHYSQVKIVEELRVVNCEVSTSSISKLKNGSSNIGSGTLRRVRNGFDKILERNFCERYDEGKHIIVKIPNCTLDKITDEEIDMVGVVERKATYIIHNGRITTPQKVEHYKRAKQEIIEIGIRLRRFNEYFSAQSDELFRAPILERLEEGVDFKCYVAEPMRAKAYIQRMSAGVKKFQEGVDNIEMIHKGLKEKFREINTNNYFEGQMKLYQYNITPVFYASIVDPESENGKMFISPYLYGIRRANCPVFEIPKIGNRRLFNIYWKSIKAIIYPAAVSKEKVIDLLD